LVAVASLVAFATPTLALDIALTNDDGWDAMGITAMKEALEAAGHNVTLAAPLSNMSGSGMTLDMGMLVVAQRAPNVYSVALGPAGTASAKPSNSSLVALGLVQKSGHSPDLLISGINTSANIGMELLLSGTVGAAGHAVASVMNGPVPAIAVGTDEPDCDAACKRAHYDVVADFIVRFVAHLQTKPGFLARENGLLPAGVGLVISYPGSDAVNGIKIATQSNAVLLNGQRFTGEFKCVASCSKPTQIWAPSPLEDPTPDAKDADLGYYVDGYVTIVPIAPDITVRNPLVFKSMLEGFTP